MRPEDYSPIAPRQLDRAWDHPVRLAANEFFVTSDPDRMTDHSSSPAPAIVAASNDVEPMNRDPEMTDRVSTTADQDPVRPHGMQRALSGNAVNVNPKLQTIGRHPKSATRACPVRIDCPTRRNSAPLSILRVGRSERLDNHPGLVRPDRFEKLARRHYRYAPRRNTVDPSIVIGEMPVMPTGGQRAGSCPRTAHCRVPGRPEPCGRHAEVRVGLCEPSCRNLLWQPTIESRTDTRYN